MGFVLSEVLKAEWNKSVAYKKSVYYKILLSSYCYHCYQDDCTWNYVFWYPQFYKKLYLAKTAKINWDHSCA